MKIENAVVLVTGANRGIGLAFANELLARGARKVYAGVRDTAVAPLPVLRRCDSTSTTPATWLPLLHWHRM
ncbi:MAG TPA: SDR family NAD(P)-dependent oxidoreductase [Rhodanobacter sp.]|nr:SDR family NAD(P)-dependent oxidoreductase [Rhodanobacter sp.]